MKEYIETIPVIEAFDSGDECPFCYLERYAEQRAIKNIAGSGASYMEPHIRALTDTEGFCGDHLKKLYVYGNHLGSALMMQTHMVELCRELDQELQQFTPPEKRKLFSKPEAPTLLAWLQKRNHSCYLCSRISSTMRRYYVTFYVLTKDPEFRSKVENSKGLCMRHFEALLELSSEHLPNGQRQWFYDTVPQLFASNLKRVQADLDWYIAKFDYQNAGESWKNSRDAVSRSMQKLQGLHPADPPYKKD